MSDYWRNEKKMWKNNKKSYSESPPYIKRETLKDIEKLDSWGWEERNLKKETLEYFGVKCKISESFGPRVIEKVYFPYYSREGKLCGYKVRDFTKDKHEHDHYYVIGHVGVDCQLFGQHKCNGPYTNLRIVEGEIDLLSAFQVLLENTMSEATPEKYRSLKPQVVSIGCGTVHAVEHISSNLHFVNQYKNIWLCFDNDELSEAEKLKKNPGMRGKECTQSVGSFLLHKKVYVVKFPDYYKDCSDVLQKGKGEHLANILLFKKEEFSAEKVIKFSDVLSFEEAHKPVPVGFQTTSFPKLNKMLLGFRNSELTTLATFSGTGKSSIAFDIAAESVKQGHKPGLIFLEEMPKKTLLRAEAWYLNIHPNKYKFDPFKYASKDQIREAWEWSNNNFRVFNHYGAIKTNSLMDKIKYLFYSQGCNPIIFDHISLAISGREDSMNDTKEIDVAMAQIGAFCASNPVHIFVVSHVNRSASSGNKRPDKPEWRRFEKEYLRGCVDKDTEYLGENGWKKISEYDPESNEKIFQYSKNKDSFGIDLVTPQYVKLPGNKFYHFESINKNGYVDMVLSPDHRVIYFDSQKSKNIKEIDAEGVNWKHHNLVKGFKGLIPITFKRFNKNKSTRITKGARKNIFDTGFLSEHHLRLQICVNIEGILKDKKIGKVNVLLKDHAKKARLEYLLEISKIEFIRSKFNTDAFDYNFKYKNIMSGEYDLYTFIAPTKKHGFDQSYYLLNQNSLEIIDDELKYWGDKDNIREDYKIILGKKNKNDKFSKEIVKEIVCLDKFCADFFQYVFICCGYRTYIDIKQERSHHNNEVDFKIPSLKNRPKINNVTKWEDVPDEVINVSDSKSGPSGSSGPSGLPALSAQDVLERQDYKVSKEKFIYTVSKSDKERFVVFTRKNAYGRKLHKINVNEVKSIDGYQYCFKVPSGMFIARRNGNVFVTGNSSSLEGISWNIIGIHREDLPDGTRGRIQLGLLKNREATVIGDADITKMDEETGKFYDASNEIWTPNSNILSSNNAYTGHGY